MTRDGYPYPIAHEVFPGDTADKATVETVLDALKRRFHLRRVIFVADRGMVSRPILRAIEDAEMEYIVGMPLRRHRAAEAVLSQPGRYRKVNDQLHVKQVTLQGQRYILCHNSLQAEHNRQARQAVLAHLKQRIERGQAKELLRNRLVARYLKTLPQGALVVDTDAVKRAARYDGKSLLRTNTDLDPEAVVRAYKDLWRVERAFRTLRSRLWDTRLGTIELKIPKLRQAAPSPAFWSGAGEPRKPRWPSFKKPTFTASAPERGTSWHGHWAWMGWWGAKSPGSVRIWTSG
ncbi:MAG: Mobile element protein [Hydrogenibacillus schlegelii]|uniref:Mobile element protein n=1 Tax=Hydrogenibacillus schlegelii TaxID=1484 RepID=A0A2T5G3S5_HYDSH|nr:MAG: Mobile element protein [Hydrogenibacillus schlegelii]